MRQQMMTSRAKILRLRLRACPEHAEEMTGLYRSNAESSAGPRRSARQDPMAPNKPNPGRGDLGMDYGSRILGDWEFKGSGPPIRRRIAQKKPNFLVSGRKTRVDDGPQGQLGALVGGGSPPSCAKETQSCCRVDGGHGPPYEAAATATVQNKAKSPGRSRPGNPKLETRNKSEFRMTQTSKPVRGRACQTNPIAGLLM